MANGIIILNDFSFKKYGDLNFSFMSVLPFFLLWL